MKAKELIIGDWVQVKDCIDRSYYFDEYEPGEIVQIREILDNGINPNWAGAEVSSILGLEDIQPIPLTPEILEKNGFTNYGESWYIPNTEDCVMVGFHMYETTINISKDGVSFSKSTPCGYRSCYSNRKVFVHELQHALRLCGIKKEIVI